MKHTLFKVLLFCATGMLAQVPAGFNYQAVARDATGVAMANATIGVQVQIHESGIDGPVVYTQIDNPTTNANGVFTLVIGNNIGLFNDIEWAFESHFIEIGIDPSGGNAFESIGASQLLSVPYAMHAKTALKSLTDDLDWNITGDDMTSELTGNVGINSDGSLPGKKLDIKVTNGSDGIRINNASIAAPGDPIVNFQIDGTSEFTIGVDDSNADRFKINSGGSLTTSPIVSIEAAGDVGININNPNNTLDVNGDAQISSYLLVGNPDSPAPMSTSTANLYSLTLDQMEGGLSIDNECDASSFGSWVFVTPETVNDRSSIQFYNRGTGFSRSNLYTPWVWVPSGAGAVEILLSFECDLETNYDGVFMEVWNDGGWEKLTNNELVFGNGYTGVADLSNTSCSSSDEQQAWTGSGNDAIPFGIALYEISGLSGQWTRVRLVGAEDISAATGEGFRMYSISIDAEIPSFGGSFADGNIYAENNIYAGSNVLLGDLAEYFPLIGEARPGDVISMLDANREMYLKSNTAHDSRAVGIYSSNPTLTLNDPSSGVPVALQGRVPVNVTNQGGTIKKGDYLTSATVSGYAMKANKACYVVGRALEDFNKEKGSILCLVETGWRDVQSVIGNTISQNSSMGTAKILTGNRSFVVYNDAIQNESIVFVNMMADPGSRYWISDVFDGSFTINFSEVIINELPINYRIENAKMATTQSAVQSKTISVTPKYPNYTWDKKTHTCYLNGVEIDISKIELEPSVGRSVNLNEETGEMPPAIVDTEGFYVWSSAKGLKKRTP